MNDNAKLWIEALRSGDYKQGTSTLCSVATSGKRRYCCLGVAEQLRSPIRTPASLDKYGSSSLVTDEGAVRLMSVSTADWLGIDRDVLQNSEGQNIMEVDVVVSDISLAQRNDNGSTFEQIADLLEDNADTVFLP